MFRRIRGHTVLVRRDGPSVLDVGANRGGFSAAMASAYGGTYRLVEANPALASALEREGHDVLNAAVADAPGPVALNVAVNDEASSVLTLPASSPVGAVLTHTVSVPAVRLDELVAGELDVVKLDIEGAEVQALAALDAGVAHGIGQITVEFHCDPMFGFGGGDAVAAVIERFRGLGWWVGDFSGGRRLDVLMINRARVPLRRRDRAAACGLMALAVARRRAGELRRLSGSRPGPGRAR